MSSDRRDDPFRHIAEKHGIVDPESIDPFAHIEAKYRERHPDDWDDDDEMRCEEGDCDDP